MKCYKRSVQITLFIIFVLGPLQAADCNTLSMIGVPLSEKKTGYIINKFLVLSNDPPELIGGGSAELYKYKP